MQTIEKEFILAASPLQVRHYAQRQHIPSSAYKHIQYADQVLGYKQLQITLLEDFQHSTNIQSIIYTLLRTRATVELTYIQGEPPYAILTRATLADIFKGEVTDRTPLDILSEFLQRALSRRTVTENNPSNENSSSYS